MFIFGYLIIAIAKILNIAVNLYIMIIILEAVLSWFSAAIQQNEVTRLIHSLTEPVLVPLRRYLPKFIIDLSPIAAILILYFLDEFIINVIREIGERIL